MGLPLKKKAFEDLAKGYDGGKFKGRKEKTWYSTPPVSDTTDGISDQLTVFMVTNLEDPGSTAKCMDYYGVKYSLVGSEIDVFDGVRKLEEIIKFVPSVDTKYTMLLDSDDMFLTSNFTYLVETYEQTYNCKMLFQAEGWNFPRGNVEMDKFERSVVSPSSPYKHLNSGAWISDTEFLQNAVKDMIAIVPHTPGDQPVFKELYKMYYPNIRIDSNCEYFQSLAWSPWFENRYPRALNLEYES